MSSVDPVGYSSAYTPTTSTGSSEKKTDNTESSLTSDVNQDAYVPSNGATATSPTYSKPKLNKPDTEKLNSIRAGYAKNLDAFKMMVETLLSKQGKLASFNGIDLSSEKGILKLKALIDGGMEVDSETIGKAQAAISENGEFGVEKTSERLVQFAIAASGGDKSNYQAMKDAIDKGFSQAKSAWGGSLPDICDKTYKRTMEKLEEWAKS